MYHSLSSRRYARANRDHRGDLRGEGGEGEGEGDHGGGGEGAEGAGDGGEGDGGDEVDGVEGVDGEGGHGDQKVKEKGNGTTKDSKENPDQTYLNDISTRGRCIRTRQDLQLSLSLSLGVHESLEFDLGLRGERLHLFTLKRKQRKKRNRRGGYKSRRRLRDSSKEN